MYSHTSRKIWDSFAPSKSGSRLICGSQYVSIGATNFTIRQMMSAELGTKGHFARSSAFGRRGSLTRHVGLRNSILQRDEWACGRGVQCVPCCIILSPADHGQVAYGVIVAVLDAAARRRVAPCCDQLLISSQYMPAVCTAASRGTLLMASATSLTRRYTGGRLIRGS